MYLIFRYVNGYFVEISGTKYLTPVPTNENKQTNKQTENNVDNCGVQSEI